MDKVYKIMTRSEWDAAKKTDAIPLSAIDREDGFTHLSDAGQVLETARLHFAGRDDLVVAEFDANEFGDALKWEVSRGGALFPHLYGVPPVSKTLRVLTLIRSAGGYMLGEAL